MARGADSIVASSYRTSVDDIVVGISWVTVCGVFFRAVVLMMFIRIRCSAKQMRGSRARGGNDMATGLDKGGELVRVEISAKTWSTRQFAHNTREMMRVRSPHQ